MKRERVENDHAKVREVQNITNKLIREAKQLHYKKLANKLSDPHTGPMNFWNAFIRITNKTKHTNIPPIVDNNTYVSNIPPIVDNNTYVSNTQQKANIFNDYFADQCKILDNDY